MKIIYTTETGIAIIHPTGELPIQRVMEKDVPSEYAHTAYIVDDDVIPSDRTFRNAWQHDKNSGGKPEHSISENLEKAKEIHKSRLRAERLPLLQNLDFEYLVCLEKKLSTSQIISEKVRLRNLPNLCDQVKTIDELRSISINSLLPSESSSLFTKIKNFFWGRDEL